MHDQSQGSQPTMRVGDVLPGRNPRHYFDPAEMAEMEASVREKGVFTPILVRPVPGGRQLVAGERRLRAALKELGPDYQIPITVREMSDEEADELALSENAQRAQMSPAEEAQAAAKILGSCDGNREEAAKRLGWTPATLNKRLALMNCSSLVLKHLTERRIELGHAELLAAVAKDKQDTVVTRMLGLPSIPPVKVFKTQLEQLAQSLSAAIFDKASCAGCQHNSSVQGQMFGEAIQAGYCTHGDCFTQKTEEELQVRAQAMKDEYPEVRIVRAGENFTLLKLVADGPTGVGADQATACRGCQKFGAAISAVPDKLGRVFTNLCFDSKCHAAKVEERVDAEKKAQEAAAAQLAPANASSPTGKSSDEKRGVKGTPSNAAQKPSASTTVQESTRVKEYRVKVWRTALRREIASDTARSLNVLLGICLAGLGGKIDAALLCEGLTKVTGSPTKASFTFNLSGAYDASCGLDDANRKLMLTGLAASCAGKLEETDVVSLLSALAVDLGRHWKLNKEFLELLTKSEIDLVAGELGLKAAMGDKFAKLMTEKKDDVITALLNVEGFTYEGKLPKVILYTK